jgi:hypothetical protein
LFGNPAAQSSHTPAVKNLRPLIVSNNFDKTLVVLNFLPSYFGIFEEKKQEMELLSTSLLTISLLRK